MTQAPSQRYLDAYQYNAKESPLSWLATRKAKNGSPFLAAYELEAGERLRLDFERGGLQPKLGMSWSGATVRQGRKTGARGSEITDFALDARRHFAKAVASIEPNQRGLLIDVCCFLKGLEEVERERDWPRRSAKIVLKCALSQLANHYQLLPPETAKMRHWGGVDYRPSL